MLSLFSIAAMVLGGAQVLLGLFGGRTWLVGVGAAQLSVGVSLAALSPRKRRTPRLSA